MLDKIHEKSSIICHSYGVIYIDNRYTRVVHLYQDILHLLQSGKKVLFNNIILYLNCNFVMHPSKYFFRKHGHK